CGQTTWSNTMNDQAGANILSTLLRLRSGASIEKLPVDDNFWPQFMSGELGSWHNQYLVPRLHLSGDRGSRGVHPKGDESVSLLSGDVRFVFDHGNNTHSEIVLSKAGDFVFVPRNTWHTACMETPSRLLFITAGEGTRGREA